LNQSQPSESKFISLSAFVQSLKKQKVAENSIESYISDLKGFLQSQDIAVDSIEPTAITRIQQQHIESYLQHLIGKNVKYSTIRRILASIRRFFFFLEDEGIIKTNPSQAILLRSTRRNAFKPEEALQIFRYLAKRQRSQSTTEVLRFFRDELILLLMVFHGLRQYQIPKLKLSSVQQSNGTIILNVRKGFGIKLEGLILNKLRMYLVMRNSNSESVFLEPFESKPITVSGLMAMLIELRYALTLDCTPKKLFNTYLYLQDNPEEKKRILDILTFESPRNTTGVILNV
jgi:site-specific recombinase XerD